MSESDVDTIVYEAHVQPIQALGKTALVSGALSLLPVFAAVLWLTFDSPTWPFFAAAEIVIAAVFFAIYIRFRLVFSAVTATHFMKRRMVLGPVTVERSRIDRVFISRVYRGGTTDALLQLLAVDGDGNRLFALNELFWSPTSIHAIGDALGIPTTTHPVPMTRRDYYEAFPVARRWYGTRSLGVTGIVVVSAAVGGVILAVQGLGAN